MFWLKLREGRTSCKRLLVDNVVLARRDIFSLSLFFLGQRVQLLVTSLLPALLQKLVGVFFVLLQGNLAGYLAGYLAGILWDFFGPTK